MLKSFKYRLYPTKKQAELINKHIGCVRFVYNLALETKQSAWAGNKVSLSCFDLHKQLTDLKKECTWLKEVNSQSLQHSINNLDTAFTLFFKGQNNFPKFKSKYKAKQSFSIPQTISLKNDKFFIPKFREGIKIELHRPIKGKIKSATVTKTPTGKYFASILCDTGEENKKKPKIKEKTTIGIDLGIKDFLVTSNGEKIDNPKFLKKSLKRLKYIDRKFSKYKGKRTKLKRAKLHEKVANQRKDFLNKLSTNLIRENQSICLEDLNILDMLQNKDLSREITDVGWGMFVEMLKYKSEWYGVNLLKIGRFDPSSKTCSDCGAINKELQLSDREWICKGCGSVHDRDVNAAINIKNFALRNYVSGADTQNHSELPTLVGVLTCEALR